MISYIKRAIFRAKNTLIGFIMVMVLALGGLELIIPQTSEADFLLDNSAYLTNMATIQENTVLAKTGSVNSSQVAKKIKMVITGYSSTPEQTDSTPLITASGSTVRDGIVANNKYPFGTKVRIPELYGDKVFVVEDRMSAKKGNYHLDIWFSSQSEAKKFGSELTYIEILEN